jgi:glyoxylase-like metal-dependent hydrolase (beta-lactamase superfamily II)
MDRPTSPVTDVQVFPVRTPTLLPATHTNTYALGSREVLLVEPATPYEDEQAAWLGWVETLRAEGRVLKGLFVTHHHHDHIGGATALARALAVPVYAHAFTAAKLDVPEVRVLADGDRLLLEGPTPHAFDVLHTPGHAPGHLCLHDAEHGVIVAGDMVASVGTILIAPGDGDMIVYLEQLRRLSALGARWGLPAHGDAIAEPSQLFDKYVTHRLMRERIVLDAVATAGPGGASFEVVLPRAYGDVPAAVLPIAALSLRAHLDKLVVEGRVREQNGLLSTVAA